ncbi:MAG: hypothetical protein KF760_20635 [Candidatus Eremiobacteraeota bacterium]|nr:hypothetical protein [Candidatus Eremiobacteraeota bacterium]MCW5870447.1 hypothetical protein [Candidatus Eremiobacteraeota bacterium]
MKVQSVNYQIASNKPVATKAPAPKTESTPVSKEPMDVGTIAEKKDWTVLVYLNGNNATASQAVTTMRQLEFVGSNDKMHMAAQLARPKALLDKWSHDWNGVRRYEVKHNGQEFNAGAVVIDGLTGFLPGKTKGIKSDVLKDMGDVDMGKAQTLAEFLEWGVTKYPAKNYMVVMQGPSEGVSGMMHDVLHDSQMSVADLGAAFKQVHEKTGKKIDIVALNGSATNSLEVANELKDHARLLVGSQDIQSGQSMPLAMVMNEIANVSKDGEQSPLTVAQYMLLMNSMAPGALSIVDLDKIGPAKEAWNDLAKNLISAGVSRDQLHSILEKTQDFQGASKNSAYGNSRDAIHFAKLVGEEVADDKVKAAAAKAVEALEASLVGDVANGKRMEEANGISVFAPTNYGFMRPDGTPVIKDSLRDAEYSKTNFAQETQWDELLSGAAKDGKLNNTLKKFGLSENGVDKAHGLYHQHIGKVNAALGFAGMAGYMNGIQAWRGADPNGFMLLGPQTAVYAGVVGAGNEALKGVGRIINGAANLKDGGEVAQGAFDVASAAAKGVANLGYIVPALKPYAQTAGMLMFMSPWLRNIYGVYDQYKSIKDGVELGIGDNKMSTTQQVAAAASQYYGKQNLQDHAERSLWQKFAG